MNHLRGNLDAAFAGDENDPTPIAATHAGKEGTRQSYARQDVYIKETAPVVVGNFFEGLGLEDAEIIDQDVNVRIFPYEICCFRGVAEVAGKSHGPVANLRYGNVDF